MLSGRNDFRVTPAAGVGIAVDDASHFVGLGAMSPARAERAGPEDHFRDPQAGMTLERVVAHGETPIFGMKPDHQLNDAHHHY
jgi:hypothetical protein